MLICIGDRIRDSLINKNALVLSGCFVVWLRNKISINKNKQIYFSLFFILIFYFLNNQTTLGITYQKSESTTLLAPEMEMESVEPALLTFA